MGLSGLLKVTPTEIMKRLACSTFLMADAHIYKRLNNYYPYLKGVFEKIVSKVFMLHSSLNLNVNILKKYNFESETIERVYAHSPCLLCKPSTTHLLFSMGYLDKLL